MPHVEFDAEFQRRFGDHTWQLPVLRVYNQGVYSKGTHLPVPYALVVDEWVMKEDHLYPKLMTKYRDKFWHSQARRGGSKSCASLKKTIIGAAAISAPIKQIMCFGLGYLRLNNDGFNSSVYQHMAVFGSAKSLGRYYERPGQECEKIKIYLQDPSCEQKDRILLRELHERMGCSETSEVHFVSEPDGLLAIDRNTLVVTSFVPNQYPLLQIIADLFMQRSGPAAILCDRITVDPEQSLYTLYNRSSPAVARMLSRRYMVLKKGFEDHELEPDLNETIYGNSTDRVYWLHLMDLYVRKGTESYTRGVTKKYTAMF
jgi:hypothetical protein